MHNTGTDKGSAGCWRMGRRLLRARLLVLALVAGSEQKEKKERARGRKEEKRRR